MNELTQDTGTVKVLFGWDEAHSRHAVYVQLDSGLYFGMSPEQARFLGQQLIEASAKVTQ